MPQFETRDANALDMRFNFYRFAINDFVALRIGNGRCRILTLNVFTLVDQPADSDNGGMQSFQRLIRRHRNTPCNATFNHRFV